MATDYELGEIIARRVISAQHGDDVQVLLGRPRPVSGGGYACAFQILGLEDDRVCPAGGDDALQALQRAMKMIASVLHTSERYRRGELSWNGDGDLGFDPFTPHTTQLGRTPGNEDELRQLLCTATRIVADLVRGDLSLREFVQAYGRVYHWADLEGRALAEERRLLDAYADVIALHHELRPVFEAASDGGDGSGSAWMPKLPPESEHAAIEAHIKVVADGFDLRRWVIELSNPAPKLH